MTNPSQLPLFSVGQVAKAYASANGELSNAELYRMVGGEAGIPSADMDHRTPVGTSGQPRSLPKRSIRWMQQTLRQLGLLERVEGKRATWRLSQAGEAKFIGKASPGVALLAFSTKLGLAIWGSWEDVFPKLDEPISVYLSSPPYPLQRPRAYGNPTEADYADFICKAMEPIVRNLKVGGSIVLNLSNSIFLPGMPARSLYQERLTLALCDRFSLFKMDTLIWANTSAPPGPVRYASISRQQLNTGYETLLWLTNSPKDCFSDNRRVLEPHSEKHKKLIAQGGEQRVGVFSDGAYRIRKGSFSNPTAGRIPRNVIELGHHCKESIQCNRYAKEHGLQAHGAPMPLALADKVLRFLTPPDGLVADSFAGRLTTAKAAEMNGYRWIVTEQIGDYIQAGATRFPSANSNMGAI